MTGDWISACAMLRMDTSKTLKVVNGLDLNSPTIYKRLKNDAFGDHTTFVFKSNSN